MKDQEPSESSGGDQAEALARLLGQAIATAEKAELLAEMWEGLCRQLHERPNEAVQHAGDIPDILDTVAGFAVSLAKVVPVLPLMDSGAKLDVLRAHQTILRAQLVGLAYVEVVLRPGGGS